MTKGKKIKNNIDNDFDFDSSLDFDDLDFSADPFKDDRKPATKVKDGLLKGVKSRLGNGQFIRGILKDILPRGFGQTLDLSDSISVTARQLYNESLNEVRPALNDFKRASSKLVPSDSKYVPVGIQKLLLKWKDESKTSGDLGVKQQRNDSIAIQLGEIFKEQAIADEKKSRQSEANDKIREGVEIGRHRDLFSVLNHSAMSLSGMYQYQTTINLKYQKKSLELQHRQLFSLYDIVDTLSKTHALQSDAFTKIVKNTGLPDWQKIKLKELSMQRLYGKFTEAGDNAVKGMFPNTDEYLQMTARRVREKVIGGLKTNIQSFRSGLTEAEGAASMSTPGTGVDKAEVAGTVAGEEATGAMGTKLAKRLKGPLKDFIPSLVRASDYLENFNENFVDTLEKFRKNRRWENEPGIKGVLIRGAQSLLPTISMDRKFTKMGAKDLSNERPFTFRTDRSINEIIPGYLSRILQEMQILRTGNPNIDLVDYDQDRGKFVSATKILKSISSDIFPQQEIDRTKKIFDNILTKIDPNNELSEEQKAELSKALFKNKLEANEPYANLTGKSGRLTRSFLSRLEESPGEKLEFSKQLNALVRGASDPRSKIESYLEQGRQNELLKLGIIYKSDEDYALNLDALFSGKIGKDPFQAYQASQRKSIRKGAPRETDSARINTLASDDDKAPTSNCGCKSYFVDIIDRLDSSIDHYQSIEEIIKSGLNVKRSGARQTIATKAADTTDSIKKTGKRFQDKILDTFDDYKQKNKGLTALGVGENIASLISMAINPLSVTQMATGGLSGKLATAVTNKAIGVVAGEIKNRFLTPDPATIWNGVYVEGEPEPRIIPNKLVTGHYLNAITGKPITSLQEIKAAVKDADTGAVIVMTSELDKLLIKTNDNKFQPFAQFIKSPGSLTSTSNDELSKLMIKRSKEYTDLLATNAWNKAKSEFEPIKKVLTEQAKDVWVEGEKYPRMTAVKMSQGRYYDAESKKPIYLASDIKGEVKDDKGETVVSLDELDSLMVWDSGQRKFGPIRKLLRGVGAIGKGVTWYYKKIGIPLTKFNFRTIVKGGTLGANILQLTMGKGPLSVKDVYVGTEEKPRLYAVRLRNGEYFNKSDGKPIYHQKDISGEIVTEDGTVVIADEDLPNLRVYDSILKLFNPLRPIKWLAKMAGKAIGWTLKKGLKATKFLTRKLGSGAMKVASGFIRYISKPEDVYVKGESFPRLKAVLMKAGRYVSEKTGLTVFLPSDIDGPVWDQQEEIRVLDNKDLEKGLVKEDGTPFKTTMMQNIIKGFKSVNKLFSRRIKLTTKETPIPNTPLNTKGEATGEQTVSLLGDIKNLFEDYFTEKRVKGDTDGDGDREGSWEDIKAKRDADKTKREAGKPGETKKDTEKKGGLMGLLAGALDAITGFLGGFKTLFKAGGVLGGLGKLLGLGEAAGAVAAATGGMGTLGTIGAGLAAVVSSPVTLGIVGSAAVGYGAYKGYKALRRWMSKPTAIDTIRYTQYGFKKGNSNFFNKILDLEEYMKQFVKIGSEQAEIDEKKMDIEEMMSIFGLSSKDNDHKRIFGTWYIKRFKPVYLIHVSALNIIDGSTDLSKINDLKKEKKLKYIEATKFSSGPYTVTTLPVLDGSVTASTASDVATAVEAALREFATQAGGAKSNEKDFPVDAKTPSGDKPDSGLDYGKVETFRKLPGGSVSATSAIGAPVVSNAVSAFDTVRFKTYGLKELEKTKVVSLVMLEAQMAKKIMYQGTKASFDGSANDILEKVTTYFGIPDLFSNQAASWTKWFTDRFMPVYLNYCTLHMQAVNKAPKSDSAPALDPNQQYDIALALSATGGAWRVFDSPWDGYLLNMNPDTIKANLEFLKDAVKQKTLREETAKEDSSKKRISPAAVKSDAVKSLQFSKPEYIPVTSPPASIVSSSTVLNRSEPNLSGDMGVRSGGQEATGFKPDPTAKIPDPTGPGIGGVKDTIINAAKLVGVDPDIMLATAAMESDFNPNAKAGATSASGLMQFINSTWKETVNKHGGKYGYDQSTSPFDAKASAIMGAHYIKDSLSSLSKNYKGAISGVEAYLVHFMGSAGAAKFLKAMQENPGQYGSQLMPKEARANQSIFFGPNGPRTLGEIYQWFYNKIRAKASKYGINLPVNSGADTSEKSKYVMPASQPAPPSVAQASASIQDPTKSAYNPSARPAIIQQQAVQASKQASGALNDAMGFNPKAMGTAMDTVNASKNTLTADLMKNTESILSQSLNVQKETLDVMKMIYEKINSTKAPEAVPPKSEGKQYEAPKAPVSMRKSA